MKTLILILLSAILLSTTVVEIKPKTSHRMEIIEVLNSPNEKYTILKVDSNEYLVNYRGGIIKI